MKRKLILSAVASTILVSIVSAETKVEIKSGWNLVGITTKQDSGLNYQLSDIVSKNTDLKNVITSVNGQWKSFDPTIPENMWGFAQGFTELEPGKGYWIKSDGDFNLSMGDEPISVDDIDFQAGWNLVAMSPSSMSDVGTNLDGNKLKLDTAITSNDGKWKSFDPTIPEAMWSFAQGFTEIESGKGYWVKVQKLADTVTTVDGYDVELYIDNESADISTIKTALADKKASEIGDLSFDNVSNVVLSTTVDGVKHSSSYLDPHSAFGTTVSSVLDNTLNPDLIRDNLATSGASIYIYAVTEGGSPSIIANVSVYELNSDGTTGELLGATGNSGYLYLENIPESGKVVLMKDNYLPSIQEVSSTPGSASYFFMNEDSGVVTVEDGTNTVPNGRVLNSITSDTLQLDLSKPKLYMSKTGAIYIPQGSSSNGMINIIPAALQSFPDYKALSENFEQTGYKTETIGDLLVLSMAGKSFGYGNAFTDLVTFADEAGAGTLADIEVMMGVNLSDELMAKLVNDDDKVTTTTISDFKSNMELYLYKNGAWTKEANFDLKIPEATTLSDDEEKFLTKYSANGIITLNGEFYDGAYSMVALYKEAVNPLPELQPNELSLNVCVVDTETNETLKDALVKVEMGNSGVEILKEVDDTTGYAPFTILAAEGAVEEISLSVVEGKHYPVTKVLNVNALNQPVGDGNKSATTTLCFNGDGEPIKMISPPKQATVKGAVLNTDGYGIPNANVKLVAPIALSSVEKDVIKTINSRDVKGIEVASIPNANYKWYIKKHSDVIEEDATTTNDRTLQRVSEKRWLLVQEGTAKNSGNFLDYNKILNMAMQSPKDTDPDDVKIVASGQFDIAIEVQHDIDGDGKADFYELAKSKSIEPNLIGEEFYELPDSEYSHIGYLSTVLDVEKLYFSLGDKVTTEAGFSVKTETLNSGDWYGVDMSSAFMLDSDTNSTLQNLGLVDDLAFLEDPTLNNGDNLNYLNYITSSFKILGNKSRGYLRVKEENSNTDNYTYESTNWEMVVDSYIALDSGNVYVALQQQSDGSFKWVETDGDVALNSDEVENGIILQKSDSKKLLLDKAAKKISSNEFLEKLAMPISAIQTEVGFTGTPLSPDNILFDDGFTITFVPTMKVKTSDDKEMLIRMKTEMDLSDLNLKDYVALSEVFVEKPTLTPSAQYDVTDRVGLYNFSTVDMDFKQLQESENSLVRVSAQKLGFYDSPAMNVPKFAIDDPNTDPREDTKIIDITLKDRPTFSVDFNVTDEAGNPIDTAIVSIDGIKTEQDLTEFESIATLQGSTGTFENVLGGKGASRIVRVSVPDSDFIPRITTLRNLDQDKNIPITLVNSTDIPDSLANISISEIGVDYDKGLARVSTKIFDTEDGTTGARSLTASSEIYTYVNGTMVSGKISRESETSELLTFYLPLEIGQNEIIIEVANRLGINRSGAVRVDYDPTVGTVAGKIIGLEENSDYTTLVDIFSDKGIYVNTIVATTKTDVNSQFVGEYILENAMSGKEFNLMATQYDADGNIKKYSTEMTKIKIPVATTIHVDLNHMDSFSETSSPVIGAPTFDLIRDIRESDVNSSNGKLTVSATISNFDKENDYSAIYFVVNDNLQMVDKSALNGGDFSYNLNEYSVQLDEGKNIVYGMAFNPNQAYVWTKDFVIDYVPDNTTLNTLTLTLNGCEIDSGCSALPYSYVTLYKESNITGLSYLGSGETNYNGQIEFDNLASGDYWLVPEVDSTYTTKGPYKVSLPSDNNFEINVSEYEDSITFEPFSIYGIDANSSEATVSLDVEDTSGFTFSWTAEYYDENGTYIEAIIGSTETVAVPTGIYGYITLRVDVNQTASSETLSDFTDIYVEEPISQTCGDGYHFDVTENSCVANQCEAGDIIDNGACTDNQIVCDTDYHLDEDSCVEDDNTTLPNPPQTPTL